MWFSNYHPQKNFKNKYQLYNPKFFFPNYTSLHITCFYTWKGNLKVHYFHPVMIYLSFRTLKNASKMTFETQALPLEGPFQMESDTSICVTILDAE